MTLLRAKSRRCSCRPTCCKKEAASAAAVAVVDAPPGNSDHEEPDGSTCSKQTTE